ncbi:MAG: hypothetical protein O2V44_09515 [Candidatus Bathyarchaeota archaeon]|nr:hypothetical protein [Candidatus Bathyarchaeota archaeon]
MELRELLSKKPVKFLTLLLTAMLITSASAAVYYSITMEPEVTVTGLTVTFTDGDDTTTGSTVNAAWCSLALKSYPNATLTYDQAVNLTNTDGSNAHSVQLRHVSITPDGSSYVGGNFTSINFYLIAQNATQITAFTYANDGTNWSPPADTGYYLIPQSEEWAIKVETLSPAGATIGTVCNIEIAVDVQE